MTLEYVSNNIDKKILKNEQIIKYTFYELRVRENLSEEEMYCFLNLARTRLTNLNYKVYSTGQRYFYDYKEKIVKENEMLVAIKQKEDKK